MPHSPAWDVWGLSKPVLNQRKFLVASGIFWSQQIQRMLLAKLFCLGFPSELRKQIMAPPFQG